MPSSAAVVVPKSTNVMGRNTMAVVALAAAMASAVRRRPRRAASAGEAPRSKPRNTASYTTMLLSMSRPMESDRPIREMTFKVWPKTYSNAMAASRLTGTATPTTETARHSRRNRNSTASAIR